MHSLIYTVYSYRLFPLSDRSCPWFFVSWEAALCIFPYFRRIYSPCKQTSKELLCCSSWNHFARHLWHSHKTTVHGYGFSKTDHKTQFKIWLHDTCMMIAWSVLPIHCLLSKEQGIVLCKGYDFSTTTGLYTARLILLFHYQW